MPCSVWTSTKWALSLNAKAISSVSQKPMRGSAATVPIHPLLCAVINASQSVQSQRLRSPPAVCLADLPVANVAAPWCASAGQGHLAPQHVGHRWLCSNCSSACASWIWAGLRRATVMPCTGCAVSHPSWHNSFMASRTGKRFTPRRVATSPSCMVISGCQVPCKICWRSRSAIAVASDGGCGGYGLSFTLRRAWHAPLLRLKAAIVGPLPLCVRQYPAMAARATVPLSATQTTLDVPWFDLVVANALPAASRRASIGSPNKGGR